MFITEGLKTAEISWILVGWDQQLSFPGKGLNSYQIKIRADATIKAHQTFLKPALNDTYLGAPVPLFYHKRTVLDPEAQVDEYIVEKFLVINTNTVSSNFSRSGRGMIPRPQRGSPSKSFFHRYNSEIIKYCREHNLPLNVTKYLKVDPNQQVVRISAVGRGQGQGVPAGPIDPYDPLTNDQMICEGCQGWWYETNLYGVQWMQRKEDLMNRIWGWDSRTCRSCDGTFWQQGYSTLTTCTGIWQDPQGFWWIYNGTDDFWDDDFSDLEHDEYVRRSGYSLKGEPWRPAAKGQGK